MIANGGRFYETGKEVVTRSCMDLQNRNPTQPRIKQEGQNFLREPALISRVSSPFSPSFVATFYMESYSG